MAKFQLDSQLIRDLAALLDETSLTEIELRDGTHVVRVARDPAPVAGFAAPAPMAAPAAGAAPAASGGEPAVHPGAIPSPMVGTVYLAPQPGAPHFVKPGDTVVEGQTLMIVEAMKVMNPIPAPRAGRVTQVMVRDGQPVEFGEPLVVLD
ncbi:MAG: acetyl-CoA carboxylase biotin carboxyl carrier protein subunit [Alphaproteobacteria bacterium]